jgi:hypothetical protein
MNSSPEGIPNLGSTCWLSSLLQLLLSSRDVREMIQKLPSRGYLTEGLKNLPRSIHLVYSMIQRKLGTVGQQDPCEGFLLLLDIWHQEHSIKYDDSKPVYSVLQRDIAQQVLSYTDFTISPVHELFQGILEWVDSDKKYRFEPFFTLFCDLKAIPTDSERFPTNLIQMKIMIKEVLHRKKIILFPSILLFCTERDSSRIFAQDSYELCHEFTIRKVNELLVYRLKGICLHTGAMSFGHYMALRLDDQKNEWWMTDDHNVTPLHENPTIIRQVPRLMLFERVK